MIQANVVSELLLDTLKRVLCAVVKGLYMCYPYFPPNLPLMCLLSSYYNPQCCVGTTSQDRAASILDASKKDLLLVISIDTSSESLLMLASQF